MKGPEYVVTKVPVAELDEQSSLCNGEQKKPYLAYKDEVR